MNNELFSAPKMQNGGARKHAESRKFRFPIEDFISLRWYSPLESLMASLALQDVRGGPLSGGVTTFGWVSSASLDR